MSYQTNFRADDAQKAKKKELPEMAEKNYYESDHEATGKLHQAQLSGPIPSNVVNAVQNVERGDKVDDITGENYPTWTSGGNRPSSEAETKHEVTGQPRGDQKRESAEDTFDEKSEDEKKGETVQSASVKEDDKKEDDKKSDDESKTEDKKPAARRTAAKKAADDKE